MYQEPLIRQCVMLNTRLKYLNQSDEALESSIIMEINNKKPLNQFLEALDWGEYSWYNRPVELSNKKPPNMCNYIDFYTSIACHTVFVCNDYTNQPSELYVMVRAVIADIINK